MPILDFKPVSRIAPTPSGYLHFGNAVSFALTWALVRAHGGRLRLRVDDLDSPRMRPEFVRDIFEQLDWLGIDYDEGPQGPEALAARYSQRHRMGRYEEVLGALVDREPRPVYACACSRAMVRALPQGIYPGKCRDLRLDLGAKGLVWRIRVPTGREAVLSDIARGEHRARLDLIMGDFVVRRKEGFAGYHLASLVDDLDYGTNLVVRGEDLLNSSAAQVFLAESIQRGQAFARAAFCHHPLVPGADGEKLSKSRDSSPLRDLRSSLRTPDPVFKAAGALIGYAGVESGVDLVDRLGEAKTLRFSAVTHSFLSE